MGTDGQSSCGCGCHDVRSGSFFAMPPFTRVLCGAVKARGQLLASDAFHVAYWNQHFDWPWLKAALLANQLSPLQVRARARAIWCDWLSPSRSTQGAKPSDGGSPPIFRPYDVSPYSGPVAAVCVRS